MLSECHYRVFALVFMCERLRISMLKICEKCGKEKEHHAKGLCYACYRNIDWDPPTGICKRCVRKMVIHAKGLCKGCYNFVFHSERIKSDNYKRRYKLDLEIYKKLTKVCVVCGFDKIVDLHHIDHNKENNSNKNLVGLCPNHHKMIHNSYFREEIKKLLKEKGFDLPKNRKLDFKFKEK